LSKAKLILFLMCSKHQKRNQKVSAWRMHFCNLPPNSVDVLMCSFVRFAVVVSKIVCLASAVIINLAVSDAFAQASQGNVLGPAASQKKFVPVAQMRLTEKQIHGYIAATAEVHSTLDASEEGVDKLSPQTTARLDAVVQKHGLADYAEYNRVGENIGQVTSGFDEVTRRYIGREALIRLRIARVKADKKMSEVDRKEALTDLNDQLQFASPPVQYRGNIDLVVKHYDELPDGYYGD
jgi:hypothetical protein